MAITFVNKGTWAAGTTSISPGIPASMAAGDFMILQVHTCNQAVTTPSGWTVMTSSPVSTGTANAAGGTRISVYYRWWQSGDAAPTVAVTGGTVTNGIIAGYRGVDTTTPLDATPVATTLATASTTLTMTGITTATANALIHWSIARDQDLNSTTAVTAFVNANLTGITETHDQVVNTGVGGGIWCGLGFKATAGATGNLTITQTSSIAVGLTIALRPKPNNYPLTCLGGAYTLGGASAVLKRSKLLTASGGSYTLTGASAVLTKAAASPIIQHAYNVDDSGGNSTTIAATLTGVTAGNALVAFVAYSGIGVSVTVSDGTSYTESASGECADTGSSQSSRVFYLPNVSSGSHTITATFGTTLAYRRIRVFEVSGLASSSIEDKSADQYQSAIPTTTDAVSSSATATTTQADAVVLGLTQNTSEVNPGTGTLSAGTGYALIGSNQILGAEYKVVSATGTQTATFTASVAGLSRTTHVVAFKKAAASSTYTLTASGGSYSLSGGSAVISRNRNLTASGGSYALTGGSASLSRNRKLTAQGGSYILAGQSITMVKGRKLTASGGSYTVTGGTATLLRSKMLVASGGSYTLTGQQAVLTWTAGVVNYQLTALGGSYSLTGSDATLSRNRKLTASGGAYTQTGSSATLSRSKRLVASGGTYILSGGTATLLRSKRIVASGGSYTLSGGTATILRSKYLLTTGGAYTITGQQVSITWASGPNAYTLICNGGTYVLTGSAATISRNRKLIASGGSYTYTGQSATLLRSKYLLASGGAYSITGQAAIISKGYILQASGGMYQLTGSSAILQKSGMVWPLPAQVLLGVQYGPTGFDYVGTLDIFGVKYDIITGDLIKPISDKVVMTL